MTFNTPITVRLRNGATISLTEWNMVLTDDSKNRRVIAQLLPVTKPFILWEGDEYDNVGDYTQQQAEDRFRTILGENPASLLTTPEPYNILTG